MQKNGKWIAFPILFLLALPVRAAKPRQINSRNVVVAKESGRFGGWPARIYYSSNRCNTWQGPCRMPWFDQRRVMARTDYQVLGRHDLIAFLTASKKDNEEGRVFCTRTMDGGKTWKFLSWIGPEPKGFSIWEPGETP
jgi:hypothetical protein